MDYARAAGAPVDYMQGESRSDGKTYHIAAWRHWSDKKKLAFLRDLAERYGGDPAMREFTINTVLRPSGVLQDDRNYPKQAAILLRWVQDNIAYLNEPGEQLQSPWYTLRVKFADCDDQSVLLAAMAESIKLPWRFVLAGKDASGKRVRWAEGTTPTRADFYHIYVDLGWPPFTPRHWAPAEPTIKGAPLGYDVVIHGPRTFRPQSGRKGSRGRGAGVMPELGAPAPGALGFLNNPGPSGPGLGQAPGSAEEESYYLTLFKKEGLLKGTLKAIPWWQLGFGIVQSVITMLVVQKLLERLAMRQAREAHRH